MKRILLCKTDVKALPRINYLPHFEEGLLPTHQLKTISTMILPGRYMMLRCFSSCEKYLKILSKNYIYNILTIYKIVILYIYIYIKEFIIIV